MLQTSAARDRLIVVLACAAIFVVVMDATIVSVAFPQIRASLGFSEVSVAWVVNAYTLTFAGGLLLGGRLCDVFGHRRIYVLGMCVFTSAQVVAGFAGTPAVLLAARALQGVGGALLMPATLSLLTAMFPEGPRRARALAMWSSVGAVGASLGPVIGGPLTQWASWRWVFLAAVPVGAVTVMLAIKVIPSMPRRIGTRVDVVGAIFATSGLSGVVYAVMRSSVAGWASLEVLGALIAGVGLLSLFLAHQAWWARQPLLPLSIFRLRKVASGNLVMFLLGVGFFASPVLLTLYMQDVLGYSALQAGVGYLPIGVAMFLGAQVAGRLTVRLGARATAILSCLVASAGFAAQAVLLGPDRSYLISVLAPGLLLGLGSAAAFTPITVSATSGVPPDQGGVSAGLLNTMRQTSDAIGLAALTAIAAAGSTAWTHRHHGAGNDADVSAIVHGQTLAFAASAVCLALAALAAALTMPRLAPPAPTCVDKPSVTDRVRRAL